MTQHRAAAAFGRVGRKDRLDQHPAQQSPDFVCPYAFLGEFFEGRPDTLAARLVVVVQFALFEGSQAAAFFGQVDEVKVGREGPHEVERAIQIKTTTRLQQGRLFLGREVAPQLDATLADFLNLIQQGGPALLDQHIAQNAAQHSHAITQGIVYSLHVAFALVGGGQGGRVARLDGQAVFDSHVLPFQFCE